MHELLRTIDGIGNCGNRAVVVRQEFDPIAGAYGQKQFALILCAELQKNEEPGTPFYRLLNNVPNILEARLGNPVLLPIEAEEFQLKVLPKILRSLEATLAPEVRPRARAFREDFWEWTQGNWHLINRHTWLFDDELGGDKRRPRLITQEVIDRVYARFKGLQLPSKED